MNSTLVMLLAGGVGSRLNILGAARAKPAVPFGGVYRIIDFTLSNAMNSGLNTVGVLTQYKPLSLMQHIGAGEPWDFIGRTRGAKILPPRTGQADSDWYKGTADAVRQNLDFIESNNPEKVLILSGDHIYKMNYAHLIAFHREKKADVTVGMMTVPWSETNQFGIALTNEHNRVLAWEEKPQKARSNFASMGIYVFNTEYLLKALRTRQQHDFGKHILPAAIVQGRVFAYPFQGYWRDVGTLKAYWEANMDLLDKSSGMDLARWGLRTNVEEEGRLGDRAPVLVAPGATVRNSILSPGCVIHGHVDNSVLSPGVFVARDAVVSGSVVMHDCHLAAGVRLQDCILDKRVRVGENTVLGLGPEDIPNRENPHHLCTGLVVVGKQAGIPANVQVGKNAILHPHLQPGDYDQPEILPGETIKPKVPGIEV
ncbi:MAG: glucose-1-phosphate adenylyltransferase family protein [bacterium]